MIAVTSIAPGHKNKDNQQAAIDSWKKAGFEVYSINSEEEIDMISEYEVNFIPTNKTGHEHYGKPYVKLDAFRDFVKEHGDSLIINSDIIITGDIKASINNAAGGMMILNRYDYEDIGGKVTLFRSGFDAFYLTKQHANLLPDTSLALGQCHWDYWLPMVMIRNGIKLFTSRRIIIMHKKHELQYNMDAWQKTGEIFMNELGLQGSAQYNSAMAFKKINSMLNVTW